MATDASTWPTTKTQMMNSLLVLGLSVAGVIQSVSAKGSSDFKARKECSTEAHSLIIVRDGLDKFKEFNRAGGKKVSFLAETSELGQAKAIVKKNGSYSVVWALKKNDLKKARKYRNKSKKLKSEIKKLMKAYKKETKKVLKIVTLPSGTSSKIVKAFGKKKVTVIKAARKISNPKKIKKLAKKMKKAYKNKKLNGGVTIFTASTKNGPKQLKKLSKALRKVVKAEKCLKISKVRKNNKSETFESDGEEINSTASSIGQGTILKSALPNTFDTYEDEIDIYAQTRDEEDEEEEEEYENNGPEYLTDDENEDEAISEEEEENNDNVTDNEVELSVIPEAEVVNVPAADNTDIILDLVNVDDFQTNQSAVENYEVSEQLIEDQDLNAQLIGNQDLNAPLATDQGQLVENNQDVTVPVAENNDLDVTVDNQDLNL